MELQESQKTLNSLLVSKKVDSERLECLKQFIAARQSMMNTSFSLQLDDRGKYIGDRLLSDFVASPYTFAFETKGLEYAFACENETETSPVTKMRYLDQEMRKKIFESNEISFSAFFSYEVEGGVDGIAISKNGSCYAPIDLVLYQTDESPIPLSDPMINMNGQKSQRTVLFKILAKAQFAKAENSSKLTSMDWIVLEDFCDRNELLF